MDSSPVPDPVRRPRWDVLKEGGFSSKFKDAFNALLSDVIPCGGDGRAVRWPHREVPQARPDEKLRSKTLLCNSLRSRRTCLRTRQKSGFLRAHRSHPVRAQAEGGGVSRALTASLSCDRPGPSREKGETLTTVSSKAPDWAIRTPTKVELHRWIKRR